MVSLQMLNAVLNICLWLANVVFAKLLERIYVLASRLEFRLTGKTFSLNPAEVNIFRGLKSTLNMISCYKVKPSKRYISTTWVSLLILLSLISLPSEVWVETGIDERNNCQPTIKNSSGVCSTPWFGYPKSSLASAALLVERSTWTDSDWDIVYEGSSVNISLSDVHKSEIGNSILSEANKKAMASNCDVQVLRCSKCGTLTFGKDSGTYSIVVRNASTIDDPSHCRETSDKNYCRGDFTFDGMTAVCFFFWSVRYRAKSGDRRIATKGIEVLLDDEALKRVFTMLDSNVMTLKISADPERSRLYSVSCASRGLHWTDLTRAVSIYRTIQMEGLGVQKKNVNGNIDNIKPLDASDALKALFALKAADLTSNCTGLVPQYTQCGTFEISKASILVGLYSLVILLYIALQIASYNQRDVLFPMSTSSWSKYATSAREQRAHGTEDFRIEIDSEGGEERLKAVDVRKMISSNRALGEVDNSDNLKQGRGSCDAAQ